MRTLIQLLILSCILFACKVEPQPINYGTDGCHYCKMTIVDNQHAAQLVTEKGRAYKYDAIECMMNHLNKWNLPPVKFYLVTDYGSPGTLIDAREANYLISDQIPSPMGAYLSAFQDKKRRDQYLKSDEDLGLNWTELSKKYIEPGIAEK